MWKYILSFLPFETDTYLIFTIGLIAVIVIIFTRKPKAKHNSIGSVTDIDGNSYKTIQIGNQVWMAENLKVTHYQNGDSIPNIKDSLEWSNVKHGAYCDYKHNQSYSNLFGKLYNWYTIEDERHISPKGWRVPSNDDWNTLLNYLKQDEYTGGKLREEDSLCWKQSDDVSTNKSGFSALPASTRNGDGSFSPQSDESASWWTATKDSKDYASSRHLYYDFSDMFTIYFPKEFGYSVRCIKDN